MDMVRERLLGKLCNMKHRCFNPKDKSYKWYGANGIKVCDEWVNDKEKFIEWSLANGYKLGMTIERYDNTKDYCPENCCFIPMSDQPKNTNRNVYVDYHGETLFVSEVARREGVSGEAIRKRIKHGWYRVVDNPNRLRSNPTPSAEMP